MSLYIVFRVTLIVFIIALFNFFLMLFLQLVISALFDGILSSYINRKTKIIIDTVLEIITKITAVICLLCLVILAELGILYLTNILSKFF